MLNGIIQKLYKNKYFLEFNYLPSGIKITSNVKWVWYWVKSLITTSNMAIYENFMTSIAKKMLWKLCCYLNIRKE